MANRDDVLEALAHTWATRHRLASQPGTHRERARLTDRFDALLDQLLEAEEPCSPAHCG